MPAAKAKTKRKPRAPRAKPEATVARLSLHDLHPPRGSHRARIRKGRGPGSGIGKTAGRGGERQISRPGGKVRPGFEGGHPPPLLRSSKRSVPNSLQQPGQEVNLPHPVLLTDGV